MSSSKRNMFIIILLLVLFSCCYDTKKLYAYSAEEERALMEAARAMKKSGVVQFNFTDMPMDKFIFFMSEVLDVNVVMPSVTNRKVTVVMPNPVTLREAREIMISALNVQNFKVKDKGTHLIVYNSGEEYRALWDKQRNSLNSAVRPTETAGPGISARQRTSDKLRVVSSDKKLSVPDLQIPGDVSADIIERLIANPFDEMKRIRMRPSEKYGGLEMQWIQNDSILKRLGIQRGDVITAVNGIKFGSLNNIDEMIHSILKCERFDMEILRGGNNGEIITIKHSVISDDKH